MLKTQLFVTDGMHPIIEMWEEIKNRDGFPKPLGGLWTSTLLPEGGSGWTEWCEYNEYNIPKEKWKGYLLTPWKGANIYTINSFEDLERLYNKYPNPSPYSFASHTLDFEKIAKDYDAIHLTEKGQGETRLTRELNLYGWDLESTLWLKWSFDINREPIYFPINQHV